MAIKLNADLIMAVFLAVLGLAMFVGGLQMDRLEVRHIHPASIPGLVPIILGLFMLLCAGLLFRSSITKGQSEAADSSKIRGNSTKNLLITLLCCLVFALVFVGNLPFIVSSTLFISVFGMTFSWPAKAGKRAKIKSVCISIIVGVTAGTLISVMFQYGFLVRLP